MFTADNAREIKKIDLDARIEEAVRTSISRHMASIRVRREDDVNLFISIEEELHARDFKTCVPEAEDLWGQVRDVHFWWD